MPRIDQLAAVTALTDDDLIVVQDNPAGTNVARVIVAADARNYFGGGWKQPVRVATTANITLSGAQTIDGVSVIAGDRVLAKNQTTGANNGIYVCAAGAWARASDMDASAEAVPGMVVTVSEGTVNHDQAYVLATDAAITLGTTSLSFTQISGSAGALLAANNLSDVASAATSRTNLGLGGAAVLAVGTTTGTVAAGDDARITTVTFEVAGRPGALTAETAGTTKTPRLYNRSGRTWTITAAYASVDTAPTGSGVTGVVRKNGSATGALTVSISAAANTGSLTGQSLSVLDGDYLQGWPTAVGSTTPGTDLSIMLVGTT